MPITLLPATTSRAIGSSLVLNDATSVVKELIENAIDAKANVISVEISANTIDVIQIKDNGFGVGVEDRRLLCRRGCTSKIRTIEDLAALGGSSLGFRGEALASIAELSEAVVITTRVDGEVAGSTLKYGTAGALLSSASASHPAGTTVRVQDFLKLIPVRRQSALKATSKTLLAIRRLLQTYAFARPSVKLSLKILKGKNDKANWSYAAQCGAEDIRDAAIKVLGQDLAARCEIRHVEISNSGVENSGASGNYSILAFLCKVDQDLTPVSNIGHFVSIDGRPVTTSRGLMKDLVKQYRNTVRNAYSHEHCTTTAADPFICLHIRCPEQSYDVNVEPAKDEVLFSDASVVLSLAERLFRDFYGDLDESETKQTPNVRKSLKPALKDGFDMLLARRHSMSSDAGFSDRLSDESGVRVTNGGNIDPSQPLAAEIEVMDGSSKLARRSLSYDSQAEQLGAQTPKYPSNMYANDAEKWPDIHQEIVELHGVRSSLKDDDLMCVSATNPWSLAKMNATSRPVVSKTAPLIDDSGTVQLLSPRSPEDSSPCLRLPHRMLFGMETNLPSPSTSPNPQARYQNPGPPLRPWRPSARIEDRDETHRSADAIPQATTSRENGTVLTWAKAPSATTHSPSFRRPSEIYDRNRRLSQRSSASSRNSCSPSQNAHIHSSILDGPKTIQPQWLSKTTQLFRSPVRVSNNWTPSSASLMETATSRHVPMLPPQSSGANAQGSRECRDTELAEIMDFEHRKKAAIAHQRKSQLPSQKQGINTARLAQIQRASAQISSNVDTNFLAYPAQELFGQTIRPNNTSEDFEARFGDRISIPSPSNPHRNRYLAVTKSLSHAHHDAEIRPPTTDDDLTPDVDLVSHMPESDPRAYFIEHAQQQATSNGQTFTKTGLKIRRAKSTRFPLESVPVEAAVHGLVAVGIHTDVGMLEKQCRELCPFDGYVPSGTNDSIEWVPTSCEAQVWEVRIRELVRNYYRARVGDEEVVPDVEVNLARGINVHIEAG